MENKDFYLDCDGKKVHAKLDFPEENRERYPLLVVFHGFTGHMEERHVAAAAKAANEAGYATLRTEFYGHGKSEGNFADHTILIWMTQAMRIIDYAAHLDFVSEVSLAGHSQGGLAAVLTAGMMQDRLRKLILLSPAMSIASGVKEGSFLGFSFDPDHPGEMLEDASGLKLNANYVRAARVLPVEACIHDYHGPVMVVHGTKDSTIPYSCGAELAEQYRENGNDVRLVPVEGADHCYDRPEELEQVKAAIRSFLAAGR